MVSNLDLSRFQKESDEKVTAEAIKLEAGAYVCKILKAEIEEIDGDNAKLRLYVDIVKGDYKGWFKRIYEKRGEWSFNAIFTRYIVKDGVIKKSFQDLIKDLEKSNPQFTFDFKELDAAQFKNLFCGFTFGEEEYLDKNNFTRTSVRVKFSASVDKVMKGKVKTPPPVTLEDKENNKTPPKAEPKVETPTEDILADSEFVDDDDVPF